MGSHAPSLLLGLCASFLTISGFGPIFPGTTGLVCYTRLESLDLGCLLRWDCPHASSNTTYTVQTKTQGGPWQDVPWCVWISSRSCDVSLAFSNFELYNMIRLGVHLVPSTTVWMKPCKFDYSDFTFSAPSLSVSLEDNRLQVKVQFPCAASRGCSMGRCCPISQLIHPWTTVTVHNQLNVTQYQSRTVWTQDLMSYVEFTGLSPGQNYCIVANFSFPTFSLAASPKSAPQCLETLSEADDLLPVMLLGVGVGFLLFFPILSIFLRKPKPTPPHSENQPKTPALVHDPVSVAPLSLLPVDPRDIHLELADEHVSVRSSPALSPRDATQCEAAYWDSGGGPESAVPTAPSFHDAWDK